MLYLSELLVISYRQDNFGPFKAYAINSLHTLNTWKEVSYLTIIFISE